jgi:hypothetical protein
MDKQAAAAAAGRWTVLAGVLAAAAAAATVLLLLLLLAVSALLGGLPAATGLAMLSCHLTLPLPPSPPAAACHPGTRLQQCRCVPVEDQQQEQYDLRPQPAAGAATAACGMTARPVQDHCSLEVKQQQQQEQQQRDCQQGPVSCSHILAMLANHSTLKGGQQRQEQQQRQLPAAMVCWWLRASQQVLQQQQQQRPSIQWLQVAGQ